MGRRKSPWGDRGELSTWEWDEVSKGESAEREEPGKRWRRARKNMRSWSDQGQSLAEPVG